MKYKHTIDDGRYVLSSGAGHGCYFSERVPLFAEDISERFSQNEILSNMKKKSIALNKNTTKKILLTLITSLAVGLIIVFTVNGVSSGIKLIYQILAGLFTGIIIMLPALIVMSFLSKEELSSFYINRLVTSKDVEAGLRSYYAEFAALAIANHMRVKGIKKVEVSNFTIDTIDTIDTARKKSKDGFSSLVRVLILNGTCHYNHDDYSIKVRVNFNPEYYNLKVVGYSIE